jgi:hypothetical protein
MGLKQVFAKYHTDFATLYDEAADGSMLVYGVAGSGFPNGAGDTRTFKLAASSSGQKPAGVLTQRFRATDESLYTKNFWANEAVTGYPAEVIKKGVIYTDLIAGNAPANGDPCYLTSSGYYTKDLVGTVQTPLVGQFEGIKDENGFVRIRIELP